MKWRMLRFKLRTVLRFNRSCATWNRENAGDVDTEVHDRMSLVITDSLFRYQFTLLIVALHNVMVLIS